MNPVQERCPTCGSINPTEAGRLEKRRDGSWRRPVLAHSPDLCPDAFHLATPGRAGTEQRSWIECPNAEVCQSCPCAAEDDACFPGERLRAELTTARRFNDVMSDQLDSYRELRLLDEERVCELEGAINHAITKLNEAPLNQEPKAMRDYFLRVLES